MKYCRAFPCNQVAVNGAYCPEHTPARAPKEADPFYVSVRWRRFRSWYIKKNPLCQLCLASNRIEPAVMVDHIRELKDGGAPLSEENAMSLCHKCHAVKTATERNHKKNHREPYGNNRRVSQKETY
jgi:5-methylcytosine-specific restriction endonuclease McrA